MTVAICVLWMLCCVGCIATDFYAMSQGEDPFWQAWLNGDTIPFKWIWKVWK
jgi:hypothetical protein